MTEGRYIRSPLNYVGGKYRILDQILPLFPDDIETFVDMFGGGFNVGVNVDAKRYVYNDIVEPLCKLMSYLASNTPDKVVSDLEDNIQKNALTKTDAEAFYALRKKYNEYPYEDEEEKTLDFYSLVLYSFNYQVRFNQKMEYNTPFGKNRSSYNASTKKNLTNFVSRLGQMDIDVSNVSFTEMNLPGLTADDLIYCDPPYLITTGSYNDGNRGIKDWTEKEERALLDILDVLDEKGVRFALSNATRANGKTNDILLKWAERYNVYTIDNSFSNSNYHRRHKDDLTEVLITNYRKEKTYE